MRALLLTTTVVASLTLALGVAQLDPSRVERGRPSGALALESLPVGPRGHMEDSLGGTLLHRVRESSLVGLGVASTDATGAPQVAIDQVLGGKAGVRASRPKKPVVMPLPQAEPAGARVLVLLSVQKRAWVVTQVYALDSVHHVGLEALLAATLGRDVASEGGRASYRAALVRGITGGGVGTRAVAAGELEADSALAPGLDPVTVTSLANVAADLDGADPTLASLLEVLAATGDPSRASEIVDVVERPHSEVVLERFPRLLKHLGADTAAGLLARHTAAGVPALERRRAAHVLARLGATSAHGELLRLASATDDPDSASEALLGLHSLGDASAVTKARAIVRAHLLPSQRAAPATELEQILDRRNHDTLRLTVLPAGDTFRLMVAGFVLLRSNAPDRTWLEARLSRLDDAQAARFLERRAKEAWSTFDSRW